ncbi:ubiquitin carboxyl-terminal hydrolase CYLD [Aplochiton taeniatus]
MSMDVDTSPKLDVHPMGLGVGSVVEVELASGLCSGIIQWIGTLQSRTLQTMAGLELERPVGVSDGTIQGQRYFTCPAKHGLFVKLLSCRPDSRFQNSGSHSYSADRRIGKQVEDSPGILENVPPISTEMVDQVLIGRMKGIQGHINSCYMDAALFSLFSCTSVLDSLLFKLTDPQDTPIQKTLLHDIVNPLRRKGFVEGQHIMKLRQQLQQRGYSHSYTSEEKDPEEFLTLIMHYILCLEPLLKLSAGGKVQESYCYQIFLDNNHRLVLPTVQQLLEHSFHSAALKLAEEPSCLILQMPRFGKKYKMFEKIVPSLELDITDLLSEGLQQCVLCGELAYEECVDCFRDPVFSTTGLKLFCTKCSTQVHAHPQRRSHHPSFLQLPEGYSGRAGPLLPREKLQLFAVLCIETSHYVSFIKHGPKSDDWIFFDSMADRQGERDGYNIPQVQACPEVAAYLEMSPVELANQVPRDMKGVAKRLFCDAYMYLYENGNLSLYR